VYQYRIAARVALFSVLCTPQHPDFLLDAESKEETEEPVYETVLQAIAIRDLSQTAMPRCTTLGKQTSSPRFFFFFFFFFFISAPELSFHDRHCGVLPHARGRRPTYAHPLVRAREVHCYQDAYTPTATN
jgi:hypothetical protein